MSRLAAIIAVTCASVAALVAGALYVRAMRTELGIVQQQRDDARLAIADRDGTIRRLQQHAADTAKQQAQLDRTNTAIVTKLNAVQLMNRRLIDENAALRTWADTPLHDVVVRLHESPALTGADDYLKHLPSSESVHTAGDGAEHKWRPRWRADDRQGSMGDVRGQGRHDRDVSGQRTSG